MSGWLRLISLVGRMANHGFCAGGWCNQAIVRYCACGNLLALWHVCGAAKPSRGHWVFEKRTTGTATHATLYSGMEPLFQGSFRSHDLPIRLIGSQRNVFSA